LQRKENRNEKKAALERKIGEFWLARVGIVALLVGTAFFIAYPIAILPPLVHGLIGYLAVAGLFFFSRLWRVTYPYLSRILFGGGLILLYYVTLRLHFFTGHPVIANKVVALAAVIAIVGAAIAGLSFVAIIFLFLVELFTETSTPYWGIINFLVFPAILIVGLLLVPIGMWREHRRRAEFHALPSLPRVDLNQRFLGEQLSGPRRGKKGANWRGHPAHARHLSQK